AGLLARLLALEDRVVGVRHGGMLVRPAMERQTPGGAGGGIARWRRDRPHPSGPSAAWAGGRAPGGRPAARPRSRAAPRGRGTTGALPWARPPPGSGDTGPRRGVGADLVRLDTGVFEVAQEGPHGVRPHGAGPHLVADEAVPDAGRVDGQ